MPIQLATNTNHLFSLPDEIGLTFVGSNLTMTRRVKGQYQPKTGVNI
jgi:hypothetical protein